METKSDYQDLRLFLSTLPINGQQEYAKRCGTTIGYLRKAMSLGQKLDGALARKLDENSGGKVRKQYIRPDIWPELLEETAV